MRWKHLTGFTILLLLCLGANSAWAFPPSYDVSLLPADETHSYTLLNPETGEDTGSLNESLHLEDRYGLSVFVLTRRFEGNVYELETVEFEAESFIPIRATRIQKVRGMNVETEILFQSTRAVITVREPELLGGKTSTTIVEIPRESITLQQVPFALRTKPLLKGEVYSFSVIPLFAPGTDVSELTAVVEKGAEEGEAAVVRCTMGSSEWRVKIDLGKNRPVVRAESPFTGTLPLAGYSIESETVPSH